MLFKVIAREELARLFDMLAAEHEVIGPVSTGRDASGDPVYAFQKVDHFGQMSLDYPTTRIPPKRYFLPYREDLATFTVGENDWDKKVDYHVNNQQIFFGMHPCDINALNRLDKVLAEGAYPLPHYITKRRNTIIIGTSCAPRPGCFCRSMGTDTALHGFDLFLTDLGGRYFAEILTDTAFNLLKQIRTADPSEEDHVLFKAAMARRNGQFTTSVDTTDLMKILDMEFQSEVWRQWGDKCLSCGTCSNVCPTCYCYGVEETVDLSLAAARKTKMLYSCNLIDFAEVAGGHNFRPERHIRLKYRYYHKHRGFVEAYEESLCVGCGRCGQSCLAGITVPEVIASVRESS